MNNPSYHMGPSGMFHFLRIGEPMMTYKQIGRIMGITGEAVRAIEKRALDKLRSEFRRRGVKTYQQAIGE